MSKNPKNQWKLMKRANIDRGILYIFWTTWGISIQFSGKMWLMIIIKVTKNQGFTIFLEVTFFEKPQWEGGGGGGCQIVPSPAVLGLKKTMKTI